MNEATFHFDSVESATEALLTIFIAARSADSLFRFSGLTAEQLFHSGLRLEGDIDEVVARIEEISGTVREGV